jgi:GGDEF domain-containing protein
VGVATRFQQQVAAQRFPKLGQDAPGRLTISGGLATFPWDGLDGAALVRAADQRAIESKHHGKNAIELGPTDTKRD